MLAKHRDLGITAEQRFRFASLMSLAADDAGLPDDPEFRSALVALPRVGHAPGAAQLPAGRGASRRTRRSRAGAGARPHRTCHDTRDGCRRLPRHDAARPGAPDRRGARRARARRLREHRRARAVGLPLEGRRRARRRGAARDQDDARRGRRRSTRRSASCIPTRRSSSSRSTSPADRPDYLDWIGESVVAAGELTPPHRARSPGSRVCLRPHALIIAAADGAARGIWTDTVGLLFTYGDPLPAIVTGLSSSRWSPAAATSRPTTRSAAAGRASARPPAPDAPLRPAAARPPRRRPRRRRRARRRPPPSARRRRPSRSAARAPRPRRRAGRAARRR